VSQWRASAGPGGDGAKQYVTSDHNSWGILAMDMTTRYLGLTMKNPLVAGAGPLNAELSNIRRLEDMGVGAVVLP
jgi:hypothetical protein